jgi:hypothetical protein
MKDLIDKLSSYNIFNYLFPGVIFAAAGTRATSFPLLLDDIVIGVFVYYLYGVVVSRIGSLLLEAFLRWTKFVQFAPYADFVAASKIDEKIETLSEQNNMFRTLASVFLCVLLLIGADAIQKRFPSIADHFLQAAIVLLLVLFVWSFRKQTDYISVRIRRALLPQSDKRSNK